MAQALDRPLSSRMSGRSLRRTENGFVGLVPADARIGNDIGILLGGRTPYILRISSGSTSFVGEAYVPGLVKGEGMRVVRFKLEKIEVNE
jgi:hypothetical protein